MTNIQDTLTYADGSLPNGEVVVSWPMFQTNGVPVANGYERYPVVNGQIQLTLYPNVNALPGGTYYTATFELDEGAVYQEFWIVPNLPTVTLAQIRATFPPVPGLLINATQLSSGGASAGQFLGWNGSQWVPMYVTTLNVSPNTIGLTVTANAASNISVVGSPAVLGSVLSLNIPDAGSTSRGVVNTAAQTFAGAKTFLNAATFDSTATFAPVAGVTNAWGEMWFGTANNFHLGGGLILATPDGSPAVLTADRAVVKYADLSSGTLSPALPAGAITIPGSEAIRLPTGPGYSHGIGVDGADNVWLGTVSASIEAFAYLRPDFAWVANWIDMSPYQHPITANTEATPNQASVVLYKDATQWAGMGYDTNMRIWFRLGPNANGTYYYFASGGQSFDSSYYVNNNLIAREQGINLVAPPGSNVTLVGTDNPVNNRVDVTFTVNAVPLTRQIIAGVGLTGGGDLSQDRTLSVVPDTTTQRVEAAASGTLVAARKQLNFIASPSVIWNIADNPTDNRLELALNLTGTGPATPLNVAVNGILVGTESELNLIAAAGSGLSLSGVDNPVASRVDVTFNTTGFVSSVFGRSGAVVATAADYSAFYPSLTGSYADPSWIASLSWSKITGVPPVGVASVFGRTGTVVAQAGDYAAYYASLAGSYADPSWITSLSWSKITGAPATGVSSVFGRTGVVTALVGDYSAFYPSMTGSYANPAWITSLPWSKITSPPAMVNTLNGLSGAVTLAAGTGITLTPAGQTITIASTGAGSQTPWTQNIVGAGYWLAQAGTIGISATIATAPQYMLDVRGPGPSSAPWTQVHVSQDSSDSGFYIINEGAATMVASNLAYIGGNFIAKGPQGSAYSLAANQVTISTFTGATIGSPVSIVNTVNVNGNFVGIGLTGVTQPAYQLDMRGGGAVSQMHISYDGTDTGMYFTTVGPYNANISAGAVYYGGSSGWVAQNANWGFLSIGNVLQFFSGSGATVGTSINVGVPTIYAGGGLVGINTTSPTDELTVANAPQTGGVTIQGSNTDIGLTINNTASGGHKWWILSSGGSSGITAGNLNFYDATAGVCRVSINSAGHVGIATVNPNAPLHVYGPTSQMRLQNSDTGSNNNRIAYWGGNYGGDLWLVGTDIPYGNASKDFYHYTWGATGSPITFQWNTGYVGIGTVAPNAALSAVGSVIADFNSSNAGGTGNWLQFGSGSGEGISSTRQAGPNQYGLNFFTGSVMRMCISNTGSVGIATSSLNARVEIAYPDQGSSVGTFNTHLCLREMSFNMAYGLAFGFTAPSGLWTGTIQAIAGNAGTNLLLNPTGGNVGVGITAPALRFHVAGGKAGVGAQANPFSAGDFGVSRESAPASGVVYFGSSGGNYIYFDGSNWNFMPGLPAPAAPGWVAYTPGMAFAGASVTFQNSEYLIWGNTLFVKITVQLSGLPTGSTVNSISLPVSVVQPGGQSQPGHACANASGQTPAISVWCGGGTMNVYCVNWAGSNPLVYLSAILRIS